MKNEKVAQVQEVEVITACREFVIIQTVKRTAPRPRVAPPTNKLNATMSLASVAFSRLATKIITPLSWSAASSSVSVFLQRSGAIGSQQHQLLSIRSVFSEVIRQVPSDDPQKQGMLTFEDPDLADARIGRNIRGECK